MKIRTLPPSFDTESLRTALASSDVVLDAIFGFSFSGPVRAPFDSALQLIIASGLPIVSVDIPSGWHVEQGDIDGVGLTPDVLVSLTAPKEGVRAFTGRHFLGGRFVSKYVMFFSVLMMITEYLLGAWPRNFNSTFPNIRDGTKSWSFRLSYKSFRTLRFLVCTKVDSDHVMSR